VYFSDFYNYRPIFAPFYNFCSMAILVSGYTIFY